MNDYNISHCACIQSLCMYSVSFHLLAVHRVSCRVRQIGVVDASLSAHRLSCRGSRQIRVVHTKTENTYTTLGSVLQWVSLSQYIVVVTMENHEQSVSIVGGASPTSSSTSSIISTSTIRVLALQVLKGPLVSLVMVVLLELSVNIASTIITVNTDSIDITTNTTSIYYWSWC
jgi:hypothetical protein